MKKGFTLIELLVVVLIIGILSAIALPQYQKAVEKNKAVQAITLLKSLGEAQEVYYMTNGQYAIKFSDLDVQLPGNWQSGGSFYTLDVSDTHTDGEWVIQLSKETGHSGAIYMGRSSGNYAGGGFRYTPKFALESTIPEYQHLSGHTQCIELTKNGPVLSPSGKYCQKIMNGKFDSGSAQRRYILPM